MSILDKIFAHKKDEVAAAKAARSESDLEAVSEHTPVPEDFIVALRDPKRAQPRLIAEIKHRSPSKGLLCPDFDPCRLANTYAQHGSAAISVLTDSRFFGGSLDDLKAVSRLQLGIPLLRKDFIFDRYQLLEAHIAGASAALLIAAMLRADVLTSLVRSAREIGITPVIEVHTREEIQSALEAGAQVIGVNNRNLHTFEVDLETTLSLRKDIPGDVVVISESGIRTMEDVSRLAKAGVDAMLIGESIVTAQDRGAKVRVLSQTGVKPIRERGG